MSPWIMCGGYQIEITGPGEMAGHPSVAAGQRALRHAELRLHVRIQHLLLLGSVLVLAVTGVPQKLSSLGASEWLMDAVGGIETLRAIHHGAGAVLIVAALYHLWSVVFAVLAHRNVTALAMIPDAGDYRNAFANLMYFIGRRRERPVLREPTYFQKLDYWVLGWAVAAMAFTGIVRLFPARATGLLSGNAVAAALEAHGNLALLVVVWVAVVHVAYLTLSSQSSPRAGGPLHTSPDRPREDSAESGGQG
jgi:cytochrome b subunit of formate dehydrogenase